MRKLGIIAVLSLMALALAAVPALAAGEHFTKQGFPKCTITGTTASTDRTVTCTSVLAGLGNEDLTTTTSGEGSVTYFCGAPGNGNLAAGQNKSPATVSGGEPTVTPSPEFKNGKATATDSVILSAPAPSDVSPEDAGCQNDNWQVVGTGLSITEVTYTVEQGDVTLVECTRTGSNLQGSFTFKKSECTGPAVR